MKQNHTGTILAVCCFLMAMLIAYILSGCTSTKLVTKETRLVDSTAVKELSDSVRVLTSENNRLTALVEEMQYASVRFDTVYMPGDTVINTVTITKEGDIKATGKISSAYVSKSVLTKIVNEQNRVIDSLKSVKQKEIIRTFTKTEFKDKFKKVTVFPWWFWLITGVFALLWARKQFL